MRTTKELIEEMDEEIPKFDRLSLVVYFENKKVTTIDSGDGGRLEALDAAVAAGGKPLGYFGVTNRNDEPILYHRVIREYNGDDWAEDYLSDLAAEEAERLDATLDSSSGQVN